MDSLSEPVVIYGSSHSNAEGAEELRLGFIDDNVSTIAVKNFPQHQPIKSSKSQAHK